MGNKAGKEKKSLGLRKAEFWSCYLHLVFYIDEKDLHAATDSHIVLSMNSEHPALLKGQCRGRAGKYSSLNICRLFLGSFHLTIVFSHC